MASCKQHPFYLTKVTPSSLYVSSLCPVSWGHFPGGWRAGWGFGWLGCRCFPELCLPRLGRSAQAPWSSVVFLGQPVAGECGSRSPSPQVHLGSTQVDRSWWEPRRNPKLEEPFRTFFQAGVEPHGQVGSGAAGVRSGACHPDTGIGTGWVGRELSERAILRG